MYQTAGSDVDSVNDTLSFVMSLSFWISCMGADEIAFFSLFIYQTILVLIALILKHII